jgi:hypothetical protein
MRLFTVRAPARPVVALLDGWEDHYHEDAAGMSTRGALSLRVAAAFLLLACGKVEGVEATPSGEPPSDEPQEVVETNCSHDLDFAAGRLWCTHGYVGRVSSLHPSDGSGSVVVEDAQAFAVAPDHLYYVDSSGTQVRRTELTGGASEFFATTGLSYLYNLYYADEALFWVGKGGSVVEAALSSRTPRVREAGGDDPLRIHGDRVYYQDRLGVGYVDRSGQSAYNYVRIDRGVRGYLVHGDAVYYYATAWERGLWRLDWNTLEEEVIEDVITEAKGMDQDEEFLFVSSLAGVFRISKTDGQIRQLALGRASAITNDATHVYYYDQIRAAIMRVRKAVPGLCSDSQDGCEAQGGTCCEERRCSDFGVDHRHCGACCIVQRS